MAQQWHVLQARLFDWHEEHKHVLVQTYKDNQLQVHARKFYVRCALVCSTFVV